MRTFCSMALVGLLSLGMASVDEPKAKENSMADPEIKKSNGEWKKKLTNEQFCVLREKGTERAFSGAYWNSKDKGMYLCAACGQELFSSDTKFDSGTGWPSFWQAVDPQKVGTQVDKTHGMSRVEVVCSRCGGHLGHLFDDGPNPTGLRYCINSASLEFKKTAEDSEGKK